MGKYILRLYLMLIILLYVEAQSCIYAQMFKIFVNSTTLIPYSASGFNFPVTWNSAQAGFTNYSYYLVGFKMQTKLKVLSFDAKITSISSTNANFYFKFDSHSEIIYGQFGIVLLKPCPGFIRLLHFEYYPTVLSQEIRSVSLELAKVYVDFTYVIAANYVITAIFSSWKIGFRAAGHKRQVIQLIQKPIVAGRNYQEIEINSPSGLYLAITKIQSTYLVFDRTSFTPALAYYKYMGGVQWYSPYECLTVPLNFQPLINYNCMAGLTYTYTTWISSSNKMQAYLDRGFINSTVAYLVTSVHWMGLYYGVICMASCKGIQLVDYSTATSTYVCKTCTITNCIACRTLTTCNTCNSSYLLSATNKTCTTCTITNCLICASSTKCSVCKPLFFLSATNSTCTTCTVTVTNCLNCSSLTTCSACKPLFYLSATNSSCTTCTVTNCQTCSSLTTCSACKPTFMLSSTNTTCATCSVLNCLTCIIPTVCGVCKTGYYLSPTNTSCPKCLYDCITCNSGTTCLTCLFGAPVDGGCTNLTFCTKVTAGSLLINRCLNCLSTSGYNLISGLCINVMGCSSASYISNQSVCIGCNTALFFNSIPSNGTCNCNLGYIFDLSFNKCVGCPLHCLNCSIIGGGNLICYLCETDYKILAPLNDKCIKCPQNCLDCYFLNGFSACSQCMDGYYMANLVQALTTFVFCPSCLLDCLLCSSNYTCITCISGHPVPGGCTIINHCLEVIPNSKTVNKCSKCDNVGGIYLLFGLCLDVIGCMVPKLNGSQTICAMCNFMKFYKPNPINNTCFCTDGTKDIGHKCEQICGDGRLFTLQCDDGNNEDLDGCSSDCRIEDNFQCVQGSQTNPSRCIYQKYDIKLSLVSIDKIFLEDRGIFTFEISPFFTLFKHYNIYKLVNFTCNQSSSVSAIYLNGSKIIVQVDFQEDLQTNPAHITINFPLDNFLQKSFQLDFDMISDGEQLIILKSKQKYKMFMYAFHIGSLSILFLFAISLLTHKMIGLEIMRPFQIIYLVYLINEDRTPFFSVICFLSNTGYNYLYFKDHTWNIRTPIKCLCFDEANQNLSEWIMVGSTIPSMIALLVLVVIRNQLNDTGSDDDRKEDKTPLLSVVLKYFYNRVVFPVSMCTLLIFFIMSFTQQDQISNYSTHLVSCFQLITLSCIYFYQWKMLFVKEQPGIIGYEGLQRCSRYYIGYFQSFDLFSLILLATHYKGFSFFVETLLLTVITIFLVSSIFYRPYKDHIHNIGIVLNYTAAFVFVLWVNLRENDKQYYLQEENQIFWIFIVLLCLSCCTIITIVRIAYLIKIILCKKKIEHINEEKKPQRRQLTPKKMNDVRLLPYHKEYLQKYKVNYDQMLKISQQTPYFFYKPKPNDKMGANEGLKNYLLSKINKKK